MEFIERKKGDEYVNYKPKGKGKKWETRFPFDGLETADGKYAIGESIQYVPYSRKPRRIKSRHWFVYDFQTRGGHRWRYYLCGGWKTMEGAKIALERYLRGEGYNKDFETEKEYETEAKWDYFLNSKSWRS